jgi:hypothetical protein
MDYIARIMDEAKRTAAMAQRSVEAQTTQIKKEKQLFQYRWMRHFFSDDTSHAHRPIIALQQRAIWIAIATLLQAANEIPGIANVSQLIPTVLMLGSFAALWMAIKPRSERQETKAILEHKGPRLWQRIVIILVLLLMTAGMFQLYWGVKWSVSAPQFSNDGTSLDTNAAILLVEGRNPYSDSNIPELFRRFSIQANWTTPLRRGQFANRLDYPSMSELQSVLNTSYKAGVVPEFEAKVSYPALSFLTLVPFALVQDYNVLPFYMLSYLLIVFIAWKTVRRELRPWVFVLAVANVPMLASTIGGNLDIFNTLLLMVCFIKRDQRWWSAIFLGLALATKQIAWYYAPLYAIMVLQQYGWKEVFSRLTIAGLLALAINLPFIIWDYHTWYAGIMAPISDPMFAMGVGIITLSTTHLLPYYPTWVYSGLEYGGMLLTYVWYWRIGRQRPEAALLLAALPLFLAWRSLSSYFYCIAFPTFVLLAARRKPAIAPATATHPAFAFLHPAKSESRVPTTAGL